MTPVFIRILALAAISSLPLLAQQPSPSPQPPTGSSPQATPPQQTNPEPGASQTNPNAQNPNAAPVPSTGNSPEVSNPQLRPVTGELENKLDTKEAKSGDAVVVKTTETATTSSGMEIPKGSELKGHIVDVAPKGQDGQNSRVTIQFDQAQLKNGQNLPIKSVIQSVAPPGTGTQADAAGGPPAPTPPASGAGSTGSQTSGNSPTPPAASSQAPGASPSASGQPGASQAPGTVVATKGNLAIKTTSIPGVLLIGDVNGRPFSNAAGALLGANQDVHLEGGTVMVVAIMTAPPTIGAR
ncbi:MAG TPA: hypothetical protein VGL00_20935 [Terracidiphilus sp.]